MFLSELFLTLMALVFVGVSPAPSSSHGDERQPYLVGHSFRVLFQQQEDEYSAAHPFRRVLTIEGHQQDETRMNLTDAGRIILQHSGSPETDEAVSISSRYNGSPIDVDFRRDEENEEEAESALLMSSIEQQKENRFFKSPFWSHFLDKLSGSTSQISRVTITVYPASFVFTSSVTFWTTISETVTVPKFQKCIPITQFSSKAIDPMAFPDVTKTHLTTPCRSGRRSNPNLVDAAIIDQQHPSDASSSPNDGMSRVSLGNNLLEITQSPELLLSAKTDPLQLLESSFLLGEDDPISIMENRQQPIINTVMLTLTSTKTSYVFSTATIKQSFSLVLTGGLSCLPADYLVC